MRLRARQLLTLLILFATLSAERAAAAATLSAEVGWGGRTRSGRWTTIFVTVSDTNARNAVLELRTPHDSTQGMTVRLNVGVGPVPQNYFLYAPLTNSSDPSKLSLYTLDGKLIKEAYVVDMYGQSEDGNRTDPFTPNRGPFIGVSGRGPAFSSLGGVGSDLPTVTYLQPFKLPRSWRGYDALDLLVLNQPDLVSMDLEQQRAIRDWVNAGGKLLLWPGDSPQPPSGPIVDLFPAKIGDFITVNVPKPALTAAKLGARFGSFTARNLTPKPGADVVHLLGNGGGVAVTAHAGLGAVTLVNFNVSALIFDEGDVQDATQRFFQGLTKVSTPPEPVNDYSPGGQAGAAAGIMDLMGDVPGVGTFGFGYVAAVVLGMMAIVGPIDWFVLKWMRRQPWTWVTTTGWIGLITLVALSLGSLLRSGDLHFRTVSVVDQVGDHVVARTDAMGLYSPRTTDYRFSVRPGSWWEPMSTDTYAYSREVARGLPFDQDSDANLPAGDTVRVWTLRFLMGESAGMGEPVLAADLAYSRPLITGRKPKPPAACAAQSPTSPRCC